jgi:hypothetical protein
MADENPKEAATKKKVKDHQAKRKLYKHALGEAKRDEAVKKLPKRQRRKAAGAKARKALRVTLKAKEAAKAAKAAKAAEAPPAA